MPSVQSHGYATHYEDEDFTDPWRPSETILIQHGFGRNSQFWYHWVPPLAGRFRVVRRDLRGHGGSGDGGEADWSFDALVDDLADFIDGVSPGPTHLVAESTGGMLAVGLSARHPTKLRSLTLCACPTTIGDAAQRFFAADHRSWQAALLELGAEGWARWLLSQPGTFPSSDPRQLEWAIEQFGRASTSALIEYSRIISTTDVATLLPQVGVPTLILAPARSAATSVEDQRQIAALIPDAMLVPIDGQGHEIYIDRRDDCIRALQSFVSDISQRAPAIQ
ncbi:MAG TPA: alpha/beta hydrolase [Solirubrobacteraceae bacterium]|jgi:pimeloyl-ACP methyl ester carboxylesterase